MPGSLIEGDITLPWPGPDDPLLTIFRIPHGFAYFWTMADNMREVVVPRIKF